MRNPIVVLKFGSSVLENHEALPAVVLEIYREIRSLETCPACPRLESPLYRPQLFGKIFWGRDAARHGNLRSGGLYNPNESTKCCKLMLQ